MTWQSFDGLKEDLQADFLKSLVKDFEAAAAKERLPVDDKRAYMFLKGYGRVAAKAEGST